MIVAAVRILKSIQYHLSLSAIIRLAVFGHLWET